MRTPDYVNEYGHKVWEISLGRKVQCYSDNYFLITSDGKATLIGLYVAAQLVGR